MVSETSAVGGTAALGAGFRGNERSAGERHQPPE